MGIKKGITVRAETDRDATVMAACAAIHAAAPVAGCFSIQLIRTDAGNVKPIRNQSQNFHDGVPGAGRWRRFYRAVSRWRAGAESSAV